MPYILFRIEEERLCDTQKLPGFDRELQGTPQDEEGGTLIQ